MENLRTYRPPLMPLIITAMMLVSFTSGCALIRPKGEISVQVVSWPLVKQWAEPNAGLPGQKVTVLSAKDHRFVAEKTTDASGVLMFKVPPGSYIVRVSNQSEAVMVKSGQLVRLKLVAH
jgi:hypothetical protein